MVAEGLIRARRVEFVQHPPVAPGIDARDPARPGTAGHHVGDAVVVGIAGGLNTGAELLAGKPVGTPQQLLRCSRSRR